MTFGSMVQEVMAGGGYPLPSSQPCLGGLTMADATCRECGITIPPKKPQRARIYCSRACSNRNRARNHYQNTIGQNHDRSGCCELCGAAFVKTSKVPWLERFCGLRCRARAANIRRYGLTVKQYRELQDGQSGACAIHGCDRSDLVVDHCHDSGEVRGLLCSQHNVALGMVNESVGELMALANYIAAFKTPVTER